jgi:hypothetical protein
MTGATDDPQQLIEAYLVKLRMRLRGMKDEDVREIVQELRAHITDKANASGEATASTVDSALGALGSPEELASQYLTDALLSRAEISRSPVRILEGLFRWASLSIAGFFVMLGSIVGYFLGIVFMLCALLKPFHPQTAGLWISRNSNKDLSFSIRLGFGGVPVNKQEVLGWWIVPIGLLVGCGLVMLTTHFALWCARRYRRSRVLPQG